MPRVSTKKPAAKKSAKAAASAAASAAAPVPAVEAPLNETETAIIEKVERVEKVEKPAAAKGHIDRRKHAPVAPPAAAAPVAPAPVPAPVVRSPAPAPAPTPVVRPPAPAPAPMFRDEPAERTVDSVKAAAQASARQDASNLARPVLPRSCAHPPHRSSPRKKTAGSPSAGAISATRSPAR